MIAQDVSVATIDALAEAYNDLVYRAAKVQGQGLTNAARTLYLAAGTLAFAIGCHAYAPSPSFRTLWWDTQGWCKQQASRVSSAR